jgi:hypothetical protein
MGAWGTGMLENDVALDVRLTFDGVLKRGGTVQEAIAEVMEESKDDLDDEGDRADLILALTWLASEKGAVPDWLEDEAREIIESDQTLALWEESPDRSAREAAELQLIAILDETAPHPGRIGALRPEDRT